MKRSLALAAAAALVLSLGACSDDSDEGVEEAAPSPTEEVADWTAFCTLWEGRPDWADADWWSALAEVAPDEAAEVAEQVAEDLDSEEFPSEEEAEATDALIEEVADLAEENCDIAEEEEIPYGDIGSVPFLDRLLEDCEDGDADACDELYWESPLDSEYEQRAQDLGGGIPADELEDLETMAPPTPTPTPEPPPADEETDGTGDQSVDEAIARSVYDEMMPTLDQDITEEGVCDVWEVLGPEEAVDAFLEGFLSEPLVGDVYIDDVVPMDELRADVTREFEEACGA